MFSICGRDFPCNNQVFRALLALFTFLRVISLFFNMLEEIKRNSALTKLVLILTKLFTLSDSFIGVFFLTFTKYLSKNLQQIFKIVLKLRIILVEH